MILTKSFRFEASHVLPRHPGKCSRLHGHSWQLHVHISGAINSETGFVRDFAEISELVKPIIDSLDHRHLGTWGHILTDVHEMEDRHAHDNWMVPWLPPNFYPTSENLLHAIGGQLQLIKWYKLRLEETCTSSAELLRLEYDADHTTRS